MGKILRKGYTTGTCAAAATKAALYQYFRGEEPNFVEMILPKGNTLPIPIYSYEEIEGGCICSVKKDSGDDPDVTNGMLIYATIYHRKDGKGRREVEGGKGVGRVTRPGLACAIGEPAINPGPMGMIQKEIMEMEAYFPEEDSLIVEISIPKGEEIAKRTFNPKLGIVGGLSVLGTSGIVEPMSDQALIDTIKVEINIKIAEGKEYILTTPGNYGERFLKEEMNIEAKETVKCSNFIGDTLSYSVIKGVKGVLLVGHMGKLIKVAGGVMNTHSKYGDRRMEIINNILETLHVPLEDREEICDCITTEEALHRLEEKALIAPFLEEMIKAIDIALDREVKGKIETGAIVYSNEKGFLGQSENATKLLEEMNII